MSAIRSWRRNGASDLIACELRDSVSNLSTPLPTLDRIAELRAGLLGAPLASSLDDFSVVCEQKFVQAGPKAPAVRVLIYRPAATHSEALPVYLHIHGGGYVLGLPEMNAAIDRELAAELQCLVVAPDYRLAPEAPYPCGIEDCYAVLTWLQDKHRDHGIDPARIAVGGESAGGGLAAALAIYARERGGVPICFQLLDSPMLDDRTGSSSEPHPYCGQVVWTAEHNQLAWRAYLGTEPSSEGIAQVASPARVPDVAGLPSTFIIVGALDLFLEENLSYARRLIRAGVPTEIHVIPGAYHGFHLANPHAPQVRSSKCLKLSSLNAALAC